MPLGIYFDSAADQWVIQQREYREIEGPELEETGVINETRLPAIFGV
jgi:hypothetical protein